MAFQVFYECESVDQDLLNRICLISSRLNVPEAVFKRMGMFGNSHKNDWVGSRDIFLQWIYLEGEDSLSMAVARSAFR